MSITKEESNKIKEHLLKQLDNFPKDKRNQIEKQINSMTEEEVENFVKQNKLTHLGEQCIFCSIIANTTPSFKIAEDSENIAILELNPLSKGHALIIPKEHLDKTKHSTEILAEEVSKRLKEKFSPNEIKINELKIMEHALLEIVPIYGNETEKKQATEEELKFLQEEIIKTEKVKTKEPEPIIENIPVLSPKIP